MTFGDLVKIGILKSKKLSKKSNNENLAKIILHNQIVKKINTVSILTQFSIKMIEIDETFINHDSSKILQILKI